MTDSHIKPIIEFRDDILSLHMLYLEKFESMNDRERDAFCCYLEHISRPAMVIEKDFKFDKDLMDAQI